MIVEARCNIQYLCCSGAVDADYVEETRPLKKRGRRPGSVSHLLVVTIRISMLCRTVARRTSIGRGCNFGVDLFVNASN